MNPPESGRILLIDAGNTSIHAGFSAERLEHSERLVPSEIDQLQDLWNRWSPEGAPREVVLASVVPALEERIRAYLDETWGLKPRRFRTDVPHTISIELENPQTTGDDRVLNAEAAWNRFRSACVIVDCGTAVTVDLVSGEGALIGGVIAPGSAIFAKALHESCALLPDTTPERIPEVYGKDTETAMKAGIYRGFSGMVEALVEQICDDLTDTPNVIGLGGDLRFLRNTDLFDHVDRDLTLKGLLDCWRFHSKSARLNTDKEEQR